MVMSEKAACIKLGRQRRPDVKRWSVIISTTIQGLIFRISKVKIKMGKLPS